MLTRYIILDREAAISAAGESSEENTERGGPWRSGGNRRWPRQRDDDEIQSDRFGWFGTLDFRVVLALSVSWIFLGGRALGRASSGPPSDGGARSAASRARSQSPGHLAAGRPAGRTERALHTERERALHLSHESVGSAEPREIAYPAWLLDRLKRGNCGYANMQGRGRLWDLSDAPFGTLKDFASNWI